MNCAYCYESDKISGNVDNLELKNDVDKVMAHNYDIVEIEFLGGEPLLNIDGIIFCCEYIQNNYAKVKVKYLITTNGTVLNELILNTIKKYNMKIFVSIDGNKFIHNMNRFYKNKKGTYDDVIYNAKILKNEINDLRIHITLTKNTVGFLYDSVKSLYDNGFNQISVGVAHKYVNDNFYNTYVKNHEKILNHINNFENLILYPMMEIDANIRNVESLKIKNNSTFIEKSNEFIDTTDLMGELKDFYESIELTKNMYRQICDK